MVHARREEGDAPALAASGLAEAEEVAVEAQRRLEIADEEGDVAELGELHRAGSVA